MRSEPRDLAGCVMSRENVGSVRKRVCVYRVKPAEWAGGWRRKWREVNREFGKNREVIWWRTKESEENQREESEEVMTKSRMWFLLWVLTWPRCKVVDNNNSDWCVYVLWSTCLGPGISLHEGLLLWLDFNYWFHSVRVLHWWSSASHWLLVLCPNGTTGSVVDGKFTSDLLRHQVK